MLRSITEGNKISGAILEVCTVMIEPKILGERLRQLRKDKGMTLQQLAAEAGVSQPFLSGLENGDKQPRLQTLESISIALDAPIHLLLDPEVRPERLVEISQIVRQVANLSPEQIDTIRQVIATWTEPS